MARAVGQVARAAANRATSTLALLLVLVLATTFPAACGRERPPEADAPTRVPRVLLAGDSVMSELAAGIRAALGPHVDARYVISPAVAEDHTLAAALRREVVASEPDVVVVLIGTWEAPAVLAGDGWDQDYRERVAPFIEDVTATTQLVWLGHPPTRDPAESLRLAAVNAVWSELAATTDALTYVDAGRGVAPDGAFHTLLDRPGGGRAVVRNLDGRHLCPDGIVLMAQEVLGPLTELLGSDPAPAWEQGAWRDDPETIRFPQQCPEGP